MPKTPAGALARTLRESPLDALSAIGESLETLVGRKVETAPLERDGADMARLFGDTELYLFSIENESGRLQKALIALTLDGAIRSGGTYSMMSGTQIENAIESGEVPQILHESVGDVASVLCDAVSARVRERDLEALPFRRGSEYRKTRVSAWPGVLAEFDASQEWELAAAGLSVDGEDWGAALFAALASGSSVSANSEGFEELSRLLMPNPDEDEETYHTGIAIVGQESFAPAEDRCTTGPSMPVEETSPVGMNTVVAGPTSDPGSLALREMLQKLGCSVKATQTYKAGITPLDMLFIVSSNAVDLNVRLDELAGRGRPERIIACSERSTREMVLAARRGRADAFLVLPTEESKLRRLIAKLAPLPEPTPV